MTARSALATTTVPAPASVRARLGLGTVQFGMRYGRFNRLGQPSSAEVRAILGWAAARGLSTLDTARGYGNSEELLGRCGGVIRRLRVVSKTRAFDGPNIDAEALTRLHADTRDQLMRLGRSSLDGLLVHRCEDLFKPGGERLYRRLQELKAEGLVAKVGASVYTPGQVRRLTEHYDLDLVQLPLSALNRSLLDAGSLQLLHRRGVEIHARSVFVQGLLLSEPARLPPLFTSLDSALRTFRDAAAEAGMSPAQAALAFVLQVPEIDVALFGVDSLVQLRQVLDGFPDPFRLRLEPLAVADSNLVDPAEWP